MFSSLLTASQLFSSLLCSSELFLKALLSFSTLRSLSQLSLGSSPLFSCPVISTHLISAYPAHLSSSQVFYGFLNSSQLLFALCGFCHLISCFLISFLLFSNLLSFLTSSQLISCLFISSILLSAHLSSSLAQNLLQNRILVPKPRKVYTSLKLF